MNAIPCPAGDACIAERRAQLARNAFGKAGGSKSARGGKALLAGLMSCAGCGRRLHVVYAGRTHRPVCRCDNPNLLVGHKRCFTSGGARAEERVVGALLEAVAPLAIDAATEAQVCVAREEEGRRQLLEPEPRQAQHDATLAERRHAACDPENRLTASTLEKRREEALSRVQVFEERMADAPGPHDTSRT